MVRTFLDVVRGPGRIFGFPEKLHTQNMLLLLVLFFLASRLHNDTFGKAYSLVSRLQVS
jgi:hypothetical protein